MNDCAANAVDLEDPTADAFGIVHLHTDIRGDDVLEIWQPEIQNMIAVRVASLAC